MFLYRLQYHYNRHKKQLPVYILSTASQTAKHNCNSIKLQHYCERHKTNYIYYCELIEGCSHCYSIMLISKYFIVSGQHESTGCFIKRFKVVKKSLLQSVCLLHTHFRASI